MAKITCGVNAADNASFNGMTIAQVMEQYGQFFNIPKDNLVILVNDEEESDHSYMIQSDDEVEFVKSAGEKGAAQRPYLPLKSLKEIRKENVKKTELPVDRTTACVSECSYSANKFATEAQKQPVNSGRVWDQSRTRPLLEIIYD